MVPHNVRQPLLCYNAATSYSHSVAVCNEPLPCNIIKTQFVFLTIIINTLVELNILQLRADLLVFNSVVLFAVQ